MLSIVFPLIMLAVVAYFVLQQRKRLGTALATTTEYTVGQVAERLGLTLVEGDPTLNFLYLSQPRGEFARRVVMCGAPYGHRAEFEFAEELKVTTDIVVYREATHSFLCTLAVDVAASFPDFEVTLRAPNKYVEPVRIFIGKPGFQEVSLGSPALDGLFTAASTDARVGSVIGNAVGNLSAQSFVHILGTGGKVRMLITRMGLPMFAHAPEEYLFAFESIACALEGRPAPAQRAAAQMPSAAPAYTPAQ